MQTLSLSLILSACLKLYEKGDLLLQPLSPSSCLRA